MGVPNVGPKERLQALHTQRGLPSFEPFFTTWVAPQRGQGGFVDEGFRGISITS